MNEKKVQITLGKDGSVKIEAFGYKGGSCEEATEFLDKLFCDGKREYKPSYYEDGNSIVDGLPSGYCG